MTAGGGDGHGEPAGLTQAQFQRRFLYRPPQDKGEGGMLAQVLPRHDSWDIDRKCAVSRSLRARPSQQP